MKIVETIQEVRNQVKEWRKQGISVGLVPTMGYLHEGHKSLIDRAVAENDKVVVSVFVNPMQFGPKEDLASYPRDLERDAAICGEAGAALVFHPQPEEMYRRALWEDKANPFPWCLYSCVKAVSYCNARQGLFWAERCTAACSYPPYGG